MIAFFPKPGCRFLVQYDQMSDVLIATVELPAADERGALMDDFDGVIRAHQKRVYRILYALLRDPDEADCLTQECFLRAYSRRAGFRGESSLATWLTRIAINLARDHFRSRRLAFWRRLLRGRDREAESMQDMHQDPEDAFLAGERIAAVWDAISYLPVRRRTVVTLRFAEEMSIAEIARAMNLREGTVKAHLAHALEGLRTRLERGKIR